MSDFISELKYQGKTYLSWQSDELVNQGVPQGVVDTALQQQDWQKIRGRRDRLLSQTDWTITADSPLSAEQQQTFRVYRQALRDIPQDYQHPDNVQWPALPVVTTAS